MDDENSKIIITTIVVVVIFTAFAMGLGKAGEEAGTTIIV